MSKADQSASAKPSWSVRLRQPKVLVMLGLGFSSGLPFMLVGNTLGFWLREQGVTLTAIGFLSWVGLAYSFKFLWAPLIDKISIPFFGLRRGWLLIAQLMVMAGLIGMSIVTPAGGIALFTALAALTAFASSTQDIVIDAWRIEASENGDEMAMMSSSYQLGYRGALLVTDALILVEASHFGWSTSYLTMGFAMTLGLVATFFAVEPRSKNIKSRLSDTNNNSTRSSADHSTAFVVESKLWTPRGILMAIVGPFIDFFKQHKSKAFWILLAISLYRLADFVMGPMNNPFYADLGITKETIAAVRGSVGLIASLAGVAVGGLCAVRFGIYRTLLIGAIIAPISNIFFGTMSFVGPDPFYFSFVMAFENFSGGFAGTALIGYMSTLTGVGYTATQYALLSSFYTVFGKFLKGFSGASVDALRTHFDLLTSYALFFVGTSLIGIPAVILCVYLMRPSKAVAKVETKS